MSTTSVKRPEVGEIAAPELRLSISSRLFTIVAIFAMVVGIGSVLGGIAGAAYTWDQAAAQNITTPDDASLAGVPVRGPFSMWAQADIINHHQLDSTDGLYYAEMERMVPELDEAGQPVLDEAGEPVMVPNAARAGWITATTLTTSLNLGMMAYALSAFAIVVGLTLFALGFLVRRLQTAQVGVV